MPERSVPDRGGAPLNCSLSANHPSCSFTSSSVQDKLIVMTYCPRIAGDWSAWEG